ncbi:hypothetical protein UlMin_021371 [Ulmus minor]
MARDKKIGITMDFSNNRKITLKWAIDNLADKGDTLFIINISHNTLNESHNLLWSKSGSRKYQLFFILIHNCSSCCSYMIRLYWGDARKKIQEVVEDLKLDSFVMGSISNKNHICSGNDLSEYNVIHSVL